MHQLVISSLFQLTENDNRFQSGKVKVTQWQAQLLQTKHTSNIARPYGAKGISTLAERNRLSFSLSGNKPLSDN